MRFVFLVLFLTTFPIISFSQEGEKTLSTFFEDCNVALENLVGAQGGVAGVADKNFEKVQNCLQLLNRGLFDISDDVETALVDSREAKADAELVQSIQNQINQLAWGPRGWMEQIQAQASCVAIAPDSGAWISAVPRACNSTTVSCQAICAQLGSTATDGQRKSARTQSCINALHIYGNPKSDIENNPGLKTYKYNSCSNTACGPNYCCCQSR